MIITDNGFINALFRHQERYSTVKSHWAVQFILEDVSIVQTVGFVAPANGKIFIEAITKIIIINVVVKDILGLS